VKSSIGQLSISCLIISQYSRCPFGVNLKAAPLPTPATITPTDDLPTNLGRWGPAISIFLVTVLSYVDRNALAILAPTILHDTHLSTQQYGVIVSCFSIAYMMGNPLWGGLFDRFGLRKGVAAAVAIWTGASVAHAWTGTFLSFASARTVLGVGEAAAFPGGVRTIAQTLPVSKRGRGLALAYSGSSLGAMITPLVITPIALRFGWQGAFLFTGIIGGVWLIYWGFASRGIDDGIEFAPNKIPWAKPALWAFIALYGMGTMPLAFVTYDSSIYLGSRFHWSQSTLGAVLWIPPLGCEIGYFLWGWLVDRFGSHAAPGLALLPVLLAIPFAWTHSLPTGPLVLASMFLMMFVVSGISILSLAEITSVFPSHTALLGGLGAGSWGAFTALIMPTLGRMFDQGNYGTAFQVVAAAPVLGYAISRGLRGKHSRND
jgi:ACS family hexuronate transporter-like MFS transporter